MALLKKLFKKNIARKAIRTPSFLDKDRTPAPNQQPMTRALPIQITPGVTSPILELNGDDQIAVGRPVPPPLGFDDTELRRRLAALEGREIPAFDRDAFIKDVRSSINIPQFDPSQLQAGIQGLSERISNLPQFDPSALQNRLAELEGRQAPTFNPEDFREQFLSIAREGIDIPQAPTIDREELVRDITGRIKQPRPFDPSRLRERLAALESREPVAPPAFDTSAIDQRLEDITRQLAELRSAQAQPSPDPVVPPVQPLPIQPPDDLNLGIKEDAPDIQDFAKPLPVGGTIFDRLDGPAVGNMQMGEGIPFTPPNERPTPPISIGGPSGGRDDLVFAGGSPTFNERGESPVPIAAPNPVIEPIQTPTPDPVATPTGEPAAPPPAPTIPTPPGSVDPIIMGQTADEVVTDPLIRALYFGTPDQPGFFNQLQQVGANLLGAQAPGTEYDPSMTEKFFNPFEDQVVQQTVEDVLKAGEQRDIAARAQDIGRGGLSAFGSRARLTADERQEALGRGLGKALAGIRQSGFSEAQRAGLSEFDRQYGRDISQLYRPLEILRGIGGLLPGYTQATSRIGTTYGMPQDPSALGLGAALSAYSSLAPQTGSAFDSYGQTTGQG